MLVTHIEAIWEDRLRSTSGSCSPHQRCVHCPTRRSTWTTSRGPRRGFRVRVSPGRHGTSTDRLAASRGALPAALAGNGGVDPARSTVFRRTPEWGPLRTPNSAGRASAAHSTRKGDGSTDEHTLLPGLQRDPLGEQSAEVGVVVAHRHLCRADTHGSRSAGLR
ncbi:hypothetical protein NDU88_004111 [Pleurodeles waltl]|uniref:Uncharacterized protein n=1 Tax=Pleurodeles waltl TaxID=8319 RepID=A0AAV7MSJ2_PLEWA|nr:hypothetical protein NDU88_004111 [Pleurodeles waltl]